MALIQDKNLKEEKTIHLSRNKKLKANMKAHQNH